MIQLSPKNTQTMRAIHGWAGVFLGLLLYVVVVTGSIYLLGEVLSRIQQSSAPVI